MGFADLKAWVINLDERPDRMELFKENKFPFEVKRFSAIKDEPGWVGCTRSHLTILSRSDVPTVIFEDDFVFIHSWDLVENAIKQLPEDWDALYMGATLMKPVERYSENLFKITEGLCAYAIIFKSQRIVNYITENFATFETTLRKTIDVFYAYDVQQKFNCFIVSPLVGTQRAGYSDIENRETDYTQITELFKEHARSSE
jgi:GR25 family glycosyltransferase involved in LPS biosynthesis